MNSLVYVDRLGLFWQASLGFHVSERWQELRSRHARDSSFSFMHIPSLDMVRSASVSITFEVQTHGTPGCLYKPCDRAVLWRSHIITASLIPPLLPP